MVADGRKDRLPHEAAELVELGLVSPGGGKSRVLVPRNVQNVFGWSPDGKSIAFETGTGSTGKLAVVDVATGKVRSLIKLRYSPTRRLDAGLERTARHLGRRPPEVPVAGACRSTARRRP